MLSLSDLCKLSHVGRTSFLKNRFGGQYVMSGLQQLPLLSQKPCLSVLAVAGTVVLQTLVGYLFLIFWLFNSSH